MAESYMHLISFTIQKRTRYDQCVVVVSSMEDNWGENRGAVAREILWCIICLVSWMCERARSKISRVHCHRKKKRNSRRSRALRAHLIFHEFQLGKFHRRRTTKIGAKQPKIYCMAGLREISRFSDWAMSTLSTMAFIRMETTIKRFNWQF